MNALVLMPSLVWLGSGVRFLRHQIVQRLGVLPHGPLQSGDHHGGRDHPAEPSRSHAGQALRVVDPLLQRLLRRDRAVLVRQAEPAHLTAPISSRR
jgi:hypothetical protein